jgi:uncharacterized protein (TIGR02391 family)
VALAVKRYGLRDANPQVSTADFADLGIKWQYDVRMLYLLLEVESWALRLKEVDEKGSRTYELNVSAALALRGVRTLPAYLNAQATAFWGGDNPHVRAHALGPALGKIKVRALPSSTPPARSTCLAEVRAAFEGLFAAGHHREALDRAVVVLMSRLRDLSGLEIDGDKLVNEGLSREPPRVLVADPSTETGRSIQRGTHLLARGLVAAVRNPAAHGIVEPTADEAIEQMGIISFIARRIDDAESGLANRSLSH